MKTILAIALIFLGVSSFSTHAEDLTIALVGVQENTPGYKITQSLINEVGKRSKIKISFEILPAKRALLHLKNGKVDGDWVRVDGFGQDIPGLIKIMEPTASHPYTAYSARDDIKIDGWRSLENFKVLYLRGWKVVELNLKPFHNDLVPVDSVESGLKVISLGRADVFVNIPFIVASFLENNMGEFSKVKALHPPLDYLHVHTYLLPQHAALAVRIENALKSMKADGIYDLIMSGQ